LSIEDVIGVVFERHLPLEFQPGDSYHDRKGTEEQEGVISILSDGIHGPERRGRLD